MSPVFEFQFYFRAFISPVLHFYVTFIVDSFCIKAMKISFADQNPLDIPRAKHKCSLKQNQTKPI